MIYFIDFLMVEIKTAAKIVNKSEIAKYFRCFLQFVDILLGNNVKHRGLVV